MVVSCGNDEALEVSSSSEAPAAAELTAEFEKHFPGGTVIQVELRRPADAFSLTVLFGPSGSGKSTTLRCLAGLDRPERGTILFGDEIWSDAARGIFLPPQRRRIGYLFQDYALFPHLRVAQNIGYGLGKIAAPQRRQRIEEITALLGLAGLEDHYPRQLSGGQQQRVALARALVCRPRLLLLDEPLGALDLKLRKQMQLFLKRIQHDVGITFLYVTHDQEEAMTMSNRLAVMRHGRIEQLDVPERVYESPATEFVAGF